MKYLLDTNVCVDHLRRQETSQLAAKLTATPPGHIFLCSIEIGELLYGGWRSADPAATIRQVRTFCAPFISLPFDDAAAEQYGSIRAHLAGAGMPIGPNDLMIAAIGLANRLTLVTGNAAEFGRVPGLQLENWQ